MKVKISGESRAIDHLKSAYDYSQVSLLLPLPLSYVSSFSIQLMGKGAASNPRQKDLIALYDSFLNRHFSTNLLENTLFLSRNKEDFIAAILGMDDWQLIWVTPLEDPSLLRIVSNKSPNYFIHSKEENDWKLSPDQLESWCKENNGILSRAILYLPKPLSGDVWKAGEFKRLCEVANKYGVYFLREEYESTAADESLLHFYPSRSFVFYNPFYGTAGANWGLGCIILPQNSSFNSIRKQEINHGKEPLLTGLEIAALQTYFEKNNEFHLVHEKWESVLLGLRTEIYELLSVSKLKFKKSQSGNSVLLNFEAYRSLFGRKGVYNSTELCKRIFQDCKVKLVPGLELGCPPGTLVAVMYLTNLDDLDWFVNIDGQRIESSFLYKQCWNCIDGAQKLMRYLNGIN